MKQCPCCSGKQYQDCCATYHRGKEPENALVLMRSRYSAYALHLADYIIHTTHPDNPHYQIDRNKWRGEILNFSKMTYFEKLEILDFSPGEEKALVTFTAHLKQNGSDATFTEQSQFEKYQGRWVYYNGKIDRHTSFERSKE
jgi:SEC-C motif-containing protein